ncbi:hypothetical protein [uncultured Arthrobacter sp.]|uniref:hypothetical protein n=1 Tax=uncultured Arthrobacter sp. TaxID=114050 RepID=UPI002604AFCB|nr:hypothetical protein [uncultured Arthrobacter sp.]
MQQKKGEATNVQKLHQHDDGAQPAPRDNGTGGARRVTFGPFALLAGAGITHLLLATAAGVGFGWSMPWETFSFIALAAILGIPITVVGCGVALVLGLALRPVASQALHVAAFFGVFALLSALITLMVGGGGLEALVTGAVVGTAAAIGRASVWKLVTVYPEKAETSPHSSG